CSELRLSHQRKKRGLREMIAQPFSILVFYFLVMPGLVPGIHVLLSSRLEVVDGRDKSPAMTTTASSSLRPDRVRRALNEGLQLRDVLFLQPAGEIRHALVAERSLEHEVLQVDDGLLGDVAEVADVAALVDAREAVTEHAVGEEKQRAFV